jgi:hypothetical protein
MSNTKTSLASLLDEQATSARRFVIEAVPDNSKVVKVTLLTPGMPLSCNAGVTLPVNAIKSINKTGDVVSCCGKALQAVELTFADEKAMSYDDLFSTVRDVHSSVTSNLAQSFRRMSPPGDLSALLARHSQGTAYAPRAATYGSCMVDAMLNGPSDRHAFEIWMGYWANLCGSMYP